jgi:hypothetical protein
MEIVINILLVKGWFSNYQAAGTWSREKDEDCAIIFVMCFLLLWCLENT